MAKTSPSLTFTVHATCRKTRARVGSIVFKKTYAEEHEYLPCPVNTPVFMPVGTNGVMKALSPEQVESTGCRLMLSNTYHLALRPGADTVARAGGLHKFMRWPHAVLTDSGGFQMVSLSKLMNITEEMATFASPYNTDEMLELPPEESINIQNKLGSNIMMQLDDVISATAEDPTRFEEAMERSVRWLDRCNTANRNKSSQSLFPIIQGGLDQGLRDRSVKQIVSRDTIGIAIGGLSGGEAKVSFIRMVHTSTKNLPHNKPRYLMGVGFAVDMMLCVALGCDMFDCVYPTRTARFGSALINYGSIIHLRDSSFATDTGPLDKNCDCSTCKNNYSRAYLHQLVRVTHPIACQLLSVHNIRFQMRFMNQIRESITAGTFVDLMKTVLDSNYGSFSQYPDFVLEALDILQIEFST